MTCQMRSDFGWAVLIRVSDNARLVCSWVRTFHCVRRPLIVPAPRGTPPRGVEGGTGSDHCGTDVGYRSKETVDAILPWSRLTALLGGRSSFLRGGAVDSYSVPPVSSVAPTGCRVGSSYRGRIRD